MPTAAEITRMRATLNRSLPDTCQVKRRTLADDGRGGKSESYATVATIACRLSRIDGGGDEAVAETVRARGPFKVTLPVGTSLLPTDRLLINGVLYQIVDAVDATSWELSKRFRVERVTVP